MSSKSSWNDAHLPIEGEVQNAEALVAFSSAKEVCNYIQSTGIGALRSKADDAEAVEEREDVCRDDLVAELS